MDLARIARALERPRAASLVLVAACLVAYSGSPFNGFVADDHAVLEQDPVVTTPGRAFDAFTNAYRGVVYRPLTVWTFAVQWQVHGPVPWAFHLVNVLLHAVMTVLVFYLIRVLGRAGPGASLVAALVFAVHTVHTDAVSPVVGRADLLAATASVAAFLSWRRWVLAGRLFALAGTGLLTLLGLLAKESAGPLPLFAAAWVLLDRDGPVDRPLWGNLQERRRALLGAVPAFLAPLAVAGAARAAVLGAALTPAWSPYFDSVDGGAAFWTLLGIGARYLWLTVVPYPLSPDYAWESIPTASSPLEPWTLAGLVALPALVALTVRLLSRRGPPAIGAGLGLTWFLVFMLPATHIIPLMVPMAERLTYLASAGACVALAPALARAARLRPVATRVLASLDVVVLLGMTIERDRVWRDDLTLWSDAVATHPRSALSLMNLAGALVPAGETAKALGAMQRAVEVAPWRWDFRVTLADLLHDAGRHEDEARVLVEGMRSGPGDPARACRALGEVRPGIDIEACTRGLGGLPGSGPAGPTLENVMTTPR